MANRKIVYDFKGFFPISVLEKSITFAIESVS